MDWDFGIDPELVEVFPNGNVLLDEVGPHLWELGVVLVLNAAVVRTRADHVEQRGDAVNRISHQQNGPFGVELGLAISFRVMRLDNHYSLVDEALAGQTHQHQVLV